MIHDKMTDLSIKPGNIQQIKRELTDYTQTPQGMTVRSLTSVVNLFIFCSRGRVFLSFSFFPACFKRLAISTRKKSARRPG